MYIYHWVQFVRYRLGTVVALEASVLLLAPLYDKSTLQVYQIFI